HEERASMAHLEQPHLDPRWHRCNRARRRRDQEKDENGSTDSERGMPVADRGRASKRSFRSAARSHARRVGANEQGVRAARPRAAALDWLEPEHYTPRAHPSRGSAMDAKLLAFLDQLSTFGRENDRAQTDRTAKMLNIAPDTGRLLWILVVS